MPSHSYRCSAPAIPAIGLALVLVLRLPVLAVALVPLLALLLLLSLLMLWPALLLPAIAIGVARALLRPASWPAIAIGVAPAAPAPPVLAAPPPL